MEDRDYKQATQTALHLAMLVSPTGKEQRAFTALVHELEQASETPAIVLRRVVGGIYDGLAYGNWPGGTSPR